MQVCRPLTFGEGSDGSIEELFPA
ncbi:hypothetical protein CBM2606_A40002 [Cupriavidus taiwanensis]|nr:hypothetical protein CBM2606_A40002 [Cupriavidus taiwanensis]